MTSAVNEVNERLLKEKSIFVRDQKEKKEKEKERRNVILCRNTKNANANPFVEKSKTGKNG